ncbi:MAG: YceD family protein [Tranquillimonas sp.]
MHRLTGTAVREPREVALEPDAEERAAIARALELLALRKFRLTGRLIPEGRQDWRLDAELGATVVQPCGLTLEPVTTRIDEPVTRRWMANPPTVPEGAEVEMPEDDTVDPLPASVDLVAVAVEALSLALPAHPRAPGAELGAASYAEPGVAPLADEDVKPFASLADFRARLKNGED